MSRATDPPTTVEMWAAALRDALAPVLRDDEFDITVGPEPGVIEVATDDWTLRVEGLSDEEPDPPSPSLPPAAGSVGHSSSSVTAWLAIDDEPDDPVRYRAARRAVMSPADDRALAQADATLDGALRRALEAEGDPFSQDLVAAW